MPSLEGKIRTLIVPIIVGVLILGILVGYIVTGGKKWDGGDNQQVGYKNYHQRKAEEEAREKKNDNK
jgi:hypothetical protein